MAFKTYTYNFPFPLCGIQAIRIEQSERGFWYGELLDSLGRVRDREPCRTKEQVDAWAQSEFRYLINHANDIIPEPPDQYSTHML